jgi:two-component system sensor histidine kinase/response regulator
MLNNKILNEKIKERTEEIYSQSIIAVYTRVDHMFVLIFILQWIIGIVIALVVSPKAWAGQNSQIHPHVYAAVFLGGILSLLPIYLGIFQSGKTLTRYIIASAQVLWSSLFIHLTGGRIETHFHIFCSLAFIAFYRDWKVLIAPTIIIAFDHCLRGIYWPESIFGIFIASPWRWIEHSCWVILEDCFLIKACLYSTREMKEIAERTATQECVNQMIEITVEERTKELLITQKSLEKASHAKSEFLTNISHEIRTPLNGIIGMTSFLVEEGKFNSKEERYLKTIETSGEVLMSLINNILDYSKLEAKKLTLEIVTFDLRILIDEILESFILAAEKKELELIIKYNLDMPLNLIGAPGRLRQIITNLIDNAIKFTQKGYVLFSVNTEEKDGIFYFHFQIKDTGIGLPTENSDIHLFSKFTQADSSITKKFGGTGLGLSICKQLVTLMGGEIGARSRYTKGSCFWFTLPFSIDNKHESSIKPEFKNISVLIVDDNETNCMVINDLISSWGVRSHFVCSGKEALEELTIGVENSNPYQIAIIDFQMPILDGLTLGGMIKNDPKIKETKLMMLSTIGDLSIEKFKSQGFSSVHVKPISPIQLCEALNSICDKEQVNLTRQNGQIEGALNSIIQTKNLHRTKVLVVEDNIPNQQVLKAMLERLNCQIHKVANGEEALDMCRNFSYDLILMDLQMPIMDGFEATQAILLEENYRKYNAPIIALTANVQKETYDKCLEIGMKDFISKPVKFRELEKILNKWTSCAKTI